MRLVCAAWPAVTIQIKWGQKPALLQPLYCCMYLISEEGRFVGAISVGVAAPSQRLHVGHSHSQDGQLVRFPRQRAASGDHVGQLCDVGGHLVPPPPLDLAVIFPGGQTARRGGKEESRWGGKKQTGRWTTWSRVKS